MNAQTLADLFYTAENGNVCVKDGAHEEEVKQMVFDAEQAGLGWDFAYEAVRDALQYLADVAPGDIDDNEVRDHASEFADSSVDVYTVDLTKWLASALSHVGLCSQMAEEYGETFDDMADFIRRGQYYAYETAMNAVADNWPEDDDEETDETDEEGGES